MPRTFSLEEIAEHVSGQLSSKLKTETQVVGINVLSEASSQELGFFVDNKFLVELKGTSAAAVILSAENSDLCPVPAIICENPYTAYAHATALFVEGSDDLVANVDKSARISPTAKIPASVSIGPNVVIEPDVELGERVRIGAGSYIGRGSAIACDSQIYPNVSIYHDVQIGARGIIHSGAVLGSDGFGFASGDSGWIKIHQLGGVRIGSDVEIGANTTIARGALEHTTIGDKVKIDGAVFIAHNVSIGDGTAIAAQTAIAGSTKIGKNCMFAGKVGVAGHIEICDGVVAMGNAMITKSIKESGSYSSGTPLQKSHIWRKNAVRFGQLDALAARLKNIENKDN